MRRPKKRRPSGKNRRKQPKNRPDQQIKVQSEALPERPANVPAAEVSLPDSVPQEPTVPQEPAAPQKEEHEKKTADTAAVSVADAKPRQAPEKLKTDGRTISISPEFIPSPVRRHPAGSLVHPVHHAPNRVWELAPYIIRRRHAS